MLLRQGRYRELLLVVETCQAESLHFKLRSPGILAVAASKVGAPANHAVAFEMEDGPARSILGGLLAQTALSRKLWRRARSDHVTRADISPQTKWQSAELCAHHPSKMVIWLLLCSLVTLLFGSQEGRTGSLPRC